MSMDKAFASLTSGLLARKGAARPAMRPQGYAREGGIDDLGWNDMGAEPTMPRDLIEVRLPASLSGPAVPPPPVVQQQQEIAREFGEEATAVPAEPAPQRRRAPKSAPVTASAELVVRPAAATGRKAAFTLRLDPERHLRLRLACAVEHRSAQQLVIQALDTLLADMPEVERLAASLPAAGKA